MSNEHPFQTAGLGNAPFILVGEVAQALNAAGMRIVSNAGGVEISTKPGGTCDYCGTYILNMFRIRSADGRESVVGCDCVAKIAPADKSLAAEVAKLVKKRAKLATKCRNDSKLGELARIMADTSALSALPHPRGFNGQTFADYAAWMFAHAGTAGKLRLLKEIKAARGN